MKTKKPQPIVNATKMSKCNSEVCKGATRMFAFQRQGLMGWRVYVCCTCGQEKTL